MDGLRSSTGTTLVAFSDEIKSLTKCDGALCRLVVLQLTARTISDGPLPLSLRIRPSESSGSSDPAPASRARCR